MGWKPQDGHFGFDQQGRKHGDEQLRVAHDLQREIRLAGVGPSQIDLEEQGESREQRKFKENKENLKRTKKI